MVLTAELDNTLEVSERERKVEWNLKGKNDAIQPTQFGFKCNKTTCMFIVQTNLG